MKFDIGVCTVSVQVNLWWVFFLTGYLKTLLCMVLKHMCARHSHWILLSYSRDLPMFSFITIIMLLLFYFCEEFTVFAYVKVVRHNL